MDQIKKSFDPLTANKTEVKANILDKYEPQAQKISNETGVAIDAVWKEIVSQVNNHISNSRKGKKAAKVPDRKRSMSLKIESDEETEVGGPANKRAKRRTVRLPDSD